MSIFSDQDRAPHARNALQEAYAMVGYALVHLEDEFGGRWYRDSESLTEFREGVAFVNNEMLQSYLDDLLDPSSDDAVLYIVRAPRRWTQYLTPSAGLIAAIAAGISAVQGGLPPYLSVSLTAAMAFPFGMLLYGLLRTGLSRRMVFAQIVSQELSRRTGGGQRPQIRIQPAQERKRPEALANSARIVTPLF